MTELEDPARVNDHRATPGENHQEAVSLADIDRGQFKDPRRQVGSQGMPDQERKSPENHRKTGPSPCTIASDDGQRNQRRNKPQSEKHKNKKPNPRARDTFSSSFISRFGYSFLCFSALGSLSSISHTVGDSIDGEQNGAF